MPDPRRPDARPLYAQVEEILSGRIVRGEWSPGRLLPAEPEIAAELGVSPGTVRRAMEGLERLHLIERRQGRGTFVARQTSAEALHQFFRVRDRAGRPVTPDTVITEVSTDRAGLDEAEALGLPPGEAVRRVRRLRLLGGAPRMVETLVLPAALFPGLSLPLAPRRLGVEIYVHYRDAHGIIVLRAEETLGARGATAAEAESLSLAPGAPVLSIRRLAYDAAGRAVELRLSALDPRDHRYAVVLA